MTIDDARKKRTSLSVRRYCSDEARAGLDAEEPSTTRRSQEEKTLVHELDSEAPVGARKLPAFRCAAESWSSRKHIRVNG